MGTLPQARLSIVVQSRCKRAARLDNSKTVPLELVVGAGVVVLSRPRDPGARRVPAFCSSFATQRLACNGVITAPHNHECIERS